MVLPQADKVVLSWQRFEEILEEAGVLKKSQAVGDVMVNTQERLTLLVLK